MLNCNPGGGKKKKKEMENHTFYLFLLTYTFIVTGKKKTCKINSTDNTMRVKIDSLLILGICVHTFMK